MLLFLTFHGQGIRAQNQSWSMVPYILNFTGGTVNASIHPALNNTYQSQFPSASVNDPFGDLLFSVSDGTVYNRSGTNSFGINNPDYSTALPPAAQQVNGATEVLIVPVPGDCKSFYIISSEVSGNTTGP
ncbi:MAG: hypothetical protein JNG88_18720, partial [Phycisphaerales bacterium]|nr:hypothetical protein [Phycisphaerales bacterium]